MKTEILAACCAMSVVSAAARAAGETLEPVMEVEFVEAPSEEPKGSAKIETVAKPVDGFTAKLAPEERKAIGVEKLSDDQRAALETMIAKEIRLARQGDVRGFAGTFISRRTEEERMSAGLDGLTTGEKYQLDRVVSRALAATPPQPPVLITRPPSDVDLGKPVSPWETHGFVSLEYGWGSGDREYKAGTVAVTQVNTKTGTELTFAYTALEGNGPWYCRGYSLGWLARPFARWSY